MGKKLKVDRHDEGETTDKMVRIQGNAHVEVCFLSVDHIFKNPCPYNGWCSVVIPRSAAMPR